MTQTAGIPDLMAITDRRLCGGASGLRRWALSLPAGTAIQLREKDLESEALVEIGRTLRTVAAGLLIVNGSVEVALSCGADGVHLRSDQPWDEAAPAVRRQGLLLGVSTHSHQEIGAAVAAGADYALFGPVFATPEKARYGAPQGLERLERATQGDLPVLAVGGIVACNAALLARAGAHGVAAIRAFAEPDTAKALTSAWAIATGTIPTS